MRINFVIDTRGNVLPGSVSLGGDPWAALAKHHEITSQTGIHFLEELSTAAKYMQSGLDIDVTHLGPFAGSMMTKDFVPIAKAFSDLCEAAEQAGLDPIVIRTAQNALEFLRKPRND